VTRKADPAPDESVVPIGPGMALEGAQAQLMGERIARTLAGFVDEFGQPAGFALVLRAQDGTMQPFHHEAKGVQWRGFLAVAGAMLTREALKEDS
jgi:hypothetical protein